MICSVSQEEPTLIRPSPWSLTLGSVQGIPIRIHASFLLLLTWVALDEKGIRSSIEEVILLTSLFACVLLHELGHALVARRFGLRTRDIILYPFGGIASLLGEARPMAEFWIAIAGPLVNVVLALLLYPAVSFQSNWWLFGDNSLIGRIFEANVFLALFNLLPAIPMDGGRILRAVLAMLNVRKATLIASRLSQILSLFLGALALYSGNVILVVIAVFVFLNAVQEILNEKARLGAEGRIMRDVMTDIGQIQCLKHAMTVSEAMNIALKSVQPVFPVLFGANLMGIIDRETILQAAATQDGEQYISGIMSREVATVPPDLSVNELVRRFDTDPRDPVFVIDQGAPVGLIYRDKLFEFLYVHGLRKQRALEAEREFDTPDSP